MGLKPASSYVIEGAWAGNSNGDRLKSRWIVRSERTAMYYDSSTGRYYSQWNIWRKLQVKVESSSLIYGTPTRVEFNNMYATHTMNSDGTESSNSFSTLGTWMTVYLKSNNGKSYPDSDTKDGCYYTVRINQEYSGTPSSASVESTVVNISPAYIERTTPKIPAYSYGGIIPYKPDVTYTSPGTTQTTATIAIDVKTPYDYTYSVKVTPNIGEVQTKTGSGQITERDEQQYGLDTFRVSFDNLRPYTYCTCDITITCDNTRVTTYRTNFTTLPIYVESVTCPADVYVNEGEVITVIPTVSPQNASIKVFDFFGDESLRFRISYPSSPATFKWIVTNESVTVTGWQTSDAVLRLQTRDGTYIQKSINVHVCRPATSIDTIERRRVSIGGTYQLIYSISPEGATDHTVTFSSSDTSVATVSSSGVVTGVSAGEATVTLSCSRRVINEYGEVTGTTTVSTDIIISVLGDPEWNTEPVDYPHYTVSADFIDWMFDDLCVLRGCLNGYTYQYGGQTIEINIPEFDTPQTNGQLTPIYAIKSCLNDIEAAIDKIYNATKNISDIYIRQANAAYDDSVTWSGEITDGTDRMDRWYEYILNIYQFCVQEDIFPYEVTA